MFFQLIINNTREINDLQQGASKTWRIPKVLVQHLHNCIIYKAKHLSDFPILPLMLYEAFQLEQIMPTAQSVALVSKPAVNMMPLWMVSKKGRVKPTTEWLPCARLKFFITPQLG